MDFENKYDKIDSLSLRFYKARIYENMGPKDLRLRVRPLPFLLDIPKAEEKNLPVYPMFFSDQIIKGKTEKDSGSQADIVSILATPDFDKGYVVGLTQNFEGNLEKASNALFDFNAIKNYLSKRSVYPTDFTYDNLTVQHWHENVDKEGKVTGGLLECFNIKTGDKFLMSTQGWLLILTKEKVLIRCGSGSSDPSQAMAGKLFSAIEMTPSKIKMSSKTIEFDADAVRLGNRGLKLLGTTAGLIPVSVEGQSFIASQQVTF